MPYRFFVVDDDRHYARLLSYRLDKDSDHEARVFHSGEDVLDALLTLPESETPDLVLLDIMMPGLDGVETLRRMKKLRPNVPVAMVSAQGTVEVAIEAMKAGAYDYITKGQDDLVKLDAIVTHIKERGALRRQVEASRSKASGGGEGLDEIVGDSLAMQELYGLVRKTLRGNLTVAIQGESGTGKELVARAIHFNSRPRPGQDGNGPFVVVNCAAIPSELMESEFFGHEKGSFTGAHARKIGKFEEADGGTIFLDEIGELDLGLQAKLLRALQNREITRVGGSGTIKFDCRVVSATNKDILHMVADGTFREDLYYRLFQFPVQLPPLRERDEDVLVLAQHFMDAYAEDYPELKDKTLARDAIRALKKYAWPGNVRELKNVIERALLIAEGEQVAESDLLLDLTPAVTPWHQRGQATSGDGAASAVPPQPPALAVPAHAPSGTEAPVATQPRAATAGIAAEPASPSADPTADILPLEDLKRQAVEHAYHACEGNVDRAAVELGIGRATMYRLLKKYEINTES